MVLLGWWGGMRDSSASVSCKFVDKRPNESRWCGILRGRAASYSNGRVSEPRMRSYPWTDSLSHPSYSSVSCLMGLAAVLLAVAG